MLNQLEWNLIYNSQVILAGKLTEKVTFSGKPFTQKKKTIRTSTGLKDDRNSKSYVHILLSLYRRWFSGGMLTYFVAPGWLNTGRIKRCKLGESPLRGGDGGSDISQVPFFELFVRSRSLFSKFSSAMGPILKVFMYSRSQCSLLICTL